MTTYVIGDLQGCYDELQTLLKHINYQPEQDFLWFVGDLVNRGPKSLECLRFVKQLEQQGQAKTVLGNHDFHLLAAYAGFEKFCSKSDTLQDILHAKDVDELINWLRQQPLMLKHPIYNTVMVHAGIPPQWSIQAALGYAKEVETLLQREDWKNTLVNHLFGNHPNQWQETLSGWERVRYILNAFARMRYCDANGALEFTLKSAPESEQHRQKMEPYKPWFVFPNRKNKDHDIFFGHWSTLGEIDAYQVHSTDTGCLWGGKMTAYAMETKQRLSISCTQQCRPKSPKKGSNKS
ncbi:Bis(5'-nucleosyl)-tetraphosphatase, symmetrical [hydrothermal vent metagenome]|uniref:bis(5'-nucleosyl)-tetraphosphatase (symmetrical) n=1 Tax=hydrothermal vent metagenome TaxID=652676 RepID=A0A3B0VTC0_9ZZZZ